MAKTNMSDKFTNAMIDVEKDVVVEVHKDGVSVFSLSSLLDKWNGIEGVSLTVQKTSEIQPDDTEY